MDVSGDLRKIALIIIILSLLQGGKSEGASGAITGGGLNVFAKTKERGSEKVITWLTFGFAIVFFFLAILISAIQPAPQPEPEPEPEPEQIAMLITALRSIL